MDSTASAPAAPLAAKLGGVDSHGRALAKGVTWRVIGTVDTFIWSWIITGHPAPAGAIASTEVLTKIALFYIHERLWRLLRIAPNSHLRSLIKGVSWRVIGSADTFILTMIFTGQLKFAVSIASAEALTKIALFYVHERVWRKVAWGRLDETPKTDVVAAA